MSESTFSKEFAKDYATNFLESFANGAEVIQHPKTSTKWDALFKIGSVCKLIILRYKMFLFADIFTF